MPPTLATTTNNALRYPTSANNGTDFATGIADLASDIDGKWFSGTLAARPTAGTLNRLYYATDVGQFYFDTGSAWLLAAPSDTGWVTPTLAAGWGSDANQPFAYRAIGDKVFLKGQIDNTSGTTQLATAVIFTFPSQYHPPHTNAFAIGAGSNISAPIILANGNFEPQIALGSSGVVMCNGLWFSLT